MPNIGFASPPRAGRCPRRHRRPRSTTPGASSEARGTGTEAGAARRKSTTWWARVFWLEHGLRRSTSDGVRPSSGRPACAAPSGGVARPAGARGDPPPWAASPELWRKRPPISVRDREASLACLAPRPHDSRTVRGPKNGVGHVGGALRRSGAGCGARAGSGDRRRVGAIAGRGRVGRQNGGSRLSGPRFVHRGTRARCSPVARLTRLPNSRSVPRHSERRSGPPLSRKTPLARRLSCFRATPGVWPSRWWHVKLRDPAQSGQMD